MKTRQTVVRLFVLAIALACAGTHAQAQTTNYWTGTGTDWGTAGNWIGTVPGSTDVAAFTNATYTSQPSLGADFSLGMLWKAGTGTITVNASSLRALTWYGIDVGGTVYGIRMDSGAGAVTLSANVSNVLQNSQTWLNNSASALTASGALNLQSNTLTVGGTGNTTLGGVISNGSLVKTGTGTLTLNGSAVNTFTGGLTVNAGTLKLDYTNYSGNNLIDGGNALTLGGGTFLLLGQASTSNAQTFNGTTVNAGPSTVTVTPGSSGTFTLNLGTITRNTGGVLNFTTGTGGSITISTSSANVNDILGPWAFVGSGASTKYATVSGVNIIGNTASTSFSDPNDMGDNTVNYYTATTGNLTALSASKTANTLLYAGAGAGTITLGASGANNLTVNGLMNVGSGLLTITRTGGTGTISTPSGNGDLVINTANNNITISAPIGGTIGLTKTGPNTLTLAANNTFNGGINLYAGTLAISGSQSFSGPVTVYGGSFAQGGNLGNSQTLTFVGNGAFLNSGSSGISWTLPYTVINPGVTVTLNAVASGNSGSTYNFSQGLSGSGTLVFTGGTSNSPQPKTLNLNNSSGFTGSIYIDYQAVNTTSDLNFNALGDGGQIIYAGGSNTRVPLNITYTGDGDTFNTRQFVLATTVANNNPGLTINNNGTGALVFTQPISVTGTGVRTVTLAGTYTASANTFAGAIVDGTGTISFSKGGGGTWILSGTNTYTGATAVNGGTLQIGTGGTVGSISPSSAISINSGTATLVFNRSDTLTQGTDFNSVISGNLGNLIQAGGGTLILNGANTYSGATFANNGTVVLTTPTTIQNSAIGTTGAGKFLLSGATTLTVGGLSGASGNLATIIASGYTGVLTNLTLNPQTGATWTYGGVIADGATGMTVTKTGAGTQILNGVNTYTGGTELAQGTIEVGNASALGTGTLTVTGNSTLNPAYGVYPVIPNALVVNSGVTLTGPTSTQYFSLGINGVVSGSGTIVFGNNNNGNSGYKLGLFNSANTFTGTIVGTGVSGNDNILRVNSLADSSNPLVFSYVVLELNSGTASSLLFNSRHIQMNGTGPVTIRNNNGSTANTITINTDLLVTAAGNKTLTLGGSNAGLNTFGGKIADGTGAVISLTKADAGKWILTGTNTYSGPTTISGGTLQIGTGGATGTLGTGTVTNNATLIFNRSDNLLVGNTIFGSGQLIQAGTGTTILTGTNTYSGVTLINNGVLQIGNGGASGTLGTGNITNLASLVFNRSDALTVTNLITGTGALTQIGPGTLKLTRANSYAGGTMVSNSTLLVNNTTGYGTGSGAVTVWGGGTLGGTGAVASLTLQSGAVLSPGNSVGTITIPTLTMQSGSTNLIEITSPTLAPGTYDVVRSTDFVTFGGVLSLAFSGGAYTNGSVIPVYEVPSDNYDGNFEAITSTGLGPYQSALFDPATGLVTVIPEPGPVALVGGGLALLVVLRRRRK